LEQPSRGHTDVQVLKNEVETLKKEVERLRNK